MDEIERARLLATMDNDSRAWLQTLPISSVGLRMDDGTLRIAVGLRLHYHYFVHHTFAIFVVQRSPHLVLMSSAVSQVRDVTFDMLR